MEKIIFSKILVATDYTALSENAVNTACSICHKQNAALILLHVVESAAEDAPPEAHQLTLDYGTQLKNSARSHLHQLAERIRKEYGLEVEEIVHFGVVLKEILRTIETVTPDLVVIGTHGTSGFREFFIGSTAYRLIRNTTVPVLTVPGGGDWSVFRKILFPTRLIPNALEKYDLFRPMIRNNEATLYILGLNSDYEMEKIDNELELQAHLVEMMRTDEVFFEIEYDYCDNYGEKILEYADEKEADLIVISATIDFTLRAYYIGPFAQQIINHAKVPVLCIRN